jgi:hypothetical protein
MLADALNMDVLISLPVVPDHHAQPTTVNLPETGMPGGSDTRVY